MTKVVTGRSLTFAVRAVRKLELDILEQVAALRMIVLIMMMITRMNPSS